MKTVLDTNIIVSALVYGGSCAEVLKLAVAGQVTAVTSEVLVAELLDILSRKFKFSADRLLQVEQLIKRRFEKVFPAETITECRDEADNRVLEVAVTGRCQYIVTGDADLQVLHPFRGIAILKPADFLRLTI